MIIIINGSRNAGKSTTAKALAKKIPNCAYIEIDALRLFLPSLDLEQTIPVNLENAILITKNFIKKKLNIVIDYCLRKHDYDYLIKELKKSAGKIHVFTLKPRLSIALSNRGRKISADDKKRIKQQYSKKNKHQIPSLGIIIDNSNLKPDEVADLILNLI